MADQAVDFSELDKLRSVEELANMQASTQRDLESLDTEYEGLPMPPEAGSLFAEKTEIHAEIGRRIAELNARKAKLAAMAGDERKIEAPAVVIKPTSHDADIWDVQRVKNTSRTPEEADAKLHDNALRAVELTRFVGKIDQKDVQAKVATRIDAGDSDLRDRMLATGSPQYRAAFTRYIQTGGQERAGTALAVGVDGTGGYSVPVAFDPTIIAIGAHTSINPFRAACRVVNISGTDTWQALTATAVTAAYATEAAAANEQGPTFARPEYIVKRAQAFVTASFEMAQDRPDLPSEIGVLFGEAKDNLEENKFAVGAAAPTPVGMFVDGEYTAIETIGNNITAAGDLYALEAGLPLRHRANAAWFMSRAAIRAFQSYETVNGSLFNGQSYASVGNPQFSSTGNTGLRLLGYPVWETPSAPATLTTNAAIVTVLCDPSSYVIVDRVGMSVRVIPDMLDGATPSMPTGEIGIYAFWRNTAKVINVDAGRQMKINAP